MAVKNYTLSQRFFRWLLGIKDPDDFDKAQAIHDGDGPIEIEIFPDGDYTPLHKITLNPTTVKPGMGIAKGPLVYKLICRNAPAMYPQPVYNIYAGHRTGGPDELYPTDIDLLAIVIDLTKRRIKAEGVGRYAGNFRHAFDLMASAQRILGRQGELASDDKPPTT